MRIYVHIHACVRVGPFDALDIDSGGKGAAFMFLDAQRERELREVRIPQMVFENVSQTMVTFSRLGLCEDGSSHLFLRCMLLNIKKGKGRSECMYTHLDIHVDIFIYIYMDAFYTCMHAPEYAAVL